MFFQLPPYVRIVFLPVAAACSYIRSISCTSFVVNESQHATNLAVYFGVIWDKSRCDTKLENEHKNKILVRNFYFKKNVNIFYETP